MNKMNTATTATIHDVSVGTNAIINAFEDNINSNGTKWPIDVLLINIFTLFRNCYNKDIKNVDELISLAKKDIMTILNMMVEYSQRINRLSNSVVVLYIPDYSRIPTGHIREQKDSQKMIYDALDIVRKNTITHFDISKLNTNYGIKFYEIALISKSKNEFSCHVLKQLLEQMSIHFGVIKNVMMISHIPLDWHVCNLMRIDFRLLESFTGMTIAPKYFGVKLFKEASVPFKLVTHLLIGDSVLIQPQIMRKQKKDFIELAKKQQWVIKSENMIIADVNKNGYGIFLKDVKI